MIGNMALVGLHRRDINRVLDPIVDRGSQVEAGRVLADFRSALRWAVARGDLDHDPTAGMNAPVAPRGRDRDSAITKFARCGAPCRRHSPRPRSANTLLSSAW